MIKYRYLVGLSITLIPAIHLAPNTANAFQVECSNEHGTCEVNNEGTDYWFCDCGGDNSGGSTGGDEYAQLNEKELHSVCIDLLSHCNFGDSDIGLSEGGETTSTTDYFSTSEGDFSTTISESSTGYDFTSEGDVSTSITESSTGYDSSSDGEDPTSTTHSSGECDTGKDNPTTVTTDLPANTTDNPESNENGNGCSCSSVNEIGNSWMAFAMLLGAGVSLRRRRSRAC